MAIMKLKMQAIGVHDKKLHTFLLKLLIMDVFMQDASER